LRPGCFETLRARAAAADVHHHQQLEIALMPIVPVPRAKKITFFQVRLEPWADSAAQIGLEEADVALMTDLVAEAKAAQMAARQARSAARCATDRYRSAIQKMCGHGSDCIRKIKARAAAAGGNFNDVYAKSLIPPPAQSSPLPPPGMPTNFRAELRQDGTLKLTWTCKNPKGSQGTMYEVWRRDGDGAGGAGAMRFIATAGVKKFVDQSIPAGTASVIYQVIAVRSTRRGMPSTYNVSFGVGVAPRQAAIATVTTRRAAA
jgi:hypothetical protein